MSKILIFGKKIKDIYLGIDGEGLEKDEDGVEWKNLGFNGEGHRFFERNVMISGAETEKEVFSKFGILAEIAKEEENIEYRYILSRENRAAYLSDLKRKKVEFVEPDEDTKMIIVDRSAEIGEGFVESVKELKNWRKDLVLAVFVRKNPTRFLPASSREIRRWCPLKTSFYRAFRRLSPRPRTPPLLLAV